MTTTYEYSITTDFTQGQGISLSVLAQEIESDAAIEFVLDAPPWIVDDSVFIRFRRTLSGAEDAIVQPALDAIVAAHDGRFVTGQNISLEHGNMLGLTGTDHHTQYHNDSRGDARYYQKTEHLDASAGAGDAGKPIKLNSSGLVDATMIPPGGSGHGVQDEGTPLTQRSNLNFVGAGVTVSDDAGNDASVVTIPGGGGGGGDNRAIQTIDAPTGTINLDWGTYGLVRLTNVTTSSLTVTFTNPSADGTAKVRRLIVHHSANLQQVTFPSGVYVTSGQNPRCVGPVTAFTLVWTESNWFLTAVREMAALA